MKFFALALLTLVTSIAQAATAPPISVMQLYGGPTNGIVQSTGGVLGALNCGSNTNYVPTWSASGYFVCAVGGGGSSGLNQLTGDVTAGPGTGSQAATVVTVGGQTASNVAAGSVLANAATNANTNGAIVKRDGSGNFSATTITAALTGNASTATALAANPNDCSANQYATAIAANGDFTCAQPAYTSLTGQLSFTAPLVNTAGTVAMPVATNSVDGYLSAADRTTFNGKQAAGNYVTALTGDITGSGPGSTATTLATVNSNVGSFTNASITVNAKGLITAASTGAGGSGITALTGDVTASGSGSVAATVAAVGGSTASAVNTATVAANAATNANTNSTIVKRDGSGNFTASTITASLTGHASLDLALTGGTMTGALINSNAGALSAPTLSLTGAPISGGTATTTKPLVLFEPTGATSTAWGTTGTMLGINPASGTPNLFDAQFNGSSRFKLSYNGISTYGNPNNTRTWVLDYSSSNLVSIGKGGSNGWLLFSDVSTGGRGDGWFYLAADGPQLPLWPQGVSYRAATGTISALSSFIPSQGSVVNGLPVWTVYNQATSGLTGFLTAAGSTQRPSTFFGGNATSTTANAETSEAWIATMNSGTLTKWWTLGPTGSMTLPALSSAGALINNSSGVVSSSTNLTGVNAATATALAANPTDCAGGNFATAIDASGNLTCSAPAGAAAAPNTTAKTTNYNMTTSDYEIRVNCASACTITMPTPGSAGNHYRIVNYATSTFALVTIAPKVAETFCGTAMTGVHIQTPGEFWEFIDDGTNWGCAQHFTQTAQIAYAPTVGATTTPPTLATTNTKSGFWKRDGQYLTYHYSYRHTNATGAAVGSGQYKWPMPNSFLIDTTNLQASTSTSSNGYDTVGQGIHYDGSVAQVHSLQVQIYDTSNLWLGAVVGNAVGTNGWIGSSLYPITNATYQTSFDARVPVTNWEP